MTNLEDIIRRGQDRLRGRPRNWRDGLGDWWQTFSLSDLFWRIYVFLVLAYLVFGVVAMTMIVKGLAR